MLCRKAKAERNGTFVATWFTYFKQHGRFMACDSTKKRLHLQSSARSKDIS